MSNSALKELWPLVYSVAVEAEGSAATFDQLAEEVMELHLSLRGKHDHSPVMEWLEICTISLNALLQYPLLDVIRASDSWHDRHGKKGR